MGSLIHEGPGRESIHDVHRQLCLSSKHEEEGSVPSGRLDTGNIGQTDLWKTGFPVRLVCFLCKTSGQHIQQCVVEHFHESITLGMIGGGSGLSNVQMFANLL